MTGVSLYPSAGNVDTRVDVNNGQAVQQFDQQGDATYGISVSSSISPSDYRESVVISGRLASHGGDTEAQVLDVNSGGDKREWDITMDITDGPNTSDGLIELQWGPGNTIDSYTGSYGTTYPTLSATNYDLLSPLYIYGEDSVGDPYTSATWTIDLTITYDHPITTSQTIDSVAQTEMEL